MAPSQLQVNNTQAFQPVNQVIPSVGQMADPGKEVAAVTTVQDVKQKGKLVKESSTDGEN